MPDAESDGLLCRYDGYASLLSGNEWGDCPSIRCVFENLSWEWDALLDTAAWFSVMPHGAALELGKDLEGEPREVRNWEGHFTGVLVTHRVRLPQRGGRPLEVEAQWFVSPEWKRGPVIGWHTFLESITFGCEAGTSSDDEPRFLYICPPP